MELDRSRQPGSAPPDREHSEKSSENLRQRQKRKRRSQILDAAEALFNEKGFDGTTIGEIAGIAEVSSATIHNYYQGKGEVLLALVGRTDNVIRASIEQIALHKPDDPRKTINHVLEMITTESLRGLKHHVWRHAIATSIIREDMEFGIGFAGAHRKFIEAISHVIRALIDTSALSSDFDVRIISSILYKIQHTLFIELIAEQKLDMKHYRDMQEAHVNHVLRGLTSAR